jgi:hypothetical protein
MNSLRLTNVVDHSTVHTSLEIEPPCSGSPDNAAAYIRPRTDHRGQGWYISRPQAEALHDWLGRLLGREAPEPITPGVESYNAVLG